MQHESICKTETEADFKFKQAVLPSGYSLGVSDFATDDQVNQ